MPELPEVETTRRDLEPHLIGRTIGDVRFEPGGHSLAGALAPEQFADALRGRQVTGLDRRGKYLVIRFADGDALVVHRRMTGNLIHRRPEHPADPFTRAVISLDDGHELRWTDMRRFGTWVLTSGSDTGIPAMGPEPLDDAWTAADLAAALAGRKAPLKAALLDQRRVAGLGNIYADEALHHARLHPLRPAGSLTDAELDRLHRAIRAVLRRAIELQGSSMNHHVGGLGQSGSMQDEWRVYGRGGHPCAVCGEPVQRTRVVGRGTHYCAICQPEPEGERASGIGLATSGRAQTPDAEAGLTPGPSPESGRGVATQTPSPSNGRRRTAMSKQPGPAAQSPPLPDSGEGPGVRARSSVRARRPQKPRQPRPRATPYA